ncbi:hypothetical protein [Sphingomicrobium nitratireducens]|nr:hypothetical protein [Sphingomicrobium nitratireducens]
MDRRFPLAQTASPALDASRSSLRDDLKLFGTTFVAGFLFVSLFLA